MSDQPKPQEWRYEEFHPSHYKVFIGNREIGFVSSEDEAQWITLEGNAALADEREKVEQLRESHACLFSENERLRERGWPDYPTDSTYQQLREQLAAEREKVQIVMRYIPACSETAVKDALAKVKEGKV